MLLIFRSLLLVFVAYHILVTLLGYGVFQGQFPQIPALMRDGIRLVFLVFYFLVQLGSFASYWRQRKKFRYLFIGLTGISLVFSYFLDKSVYDMFIGFKYGFHYLFLFLSATFLGHIFAKQGSKRQHSLLDIKIEKFVNWFVWFLVSVVVIGFIWQLAKLVMPDFFLSLGYGPLNDFAFGTSPPLYYLTGFGGTLRWQGIFAGPNNYGYFLVIFLPLIVKFFKFSMVSWKDIFIKKQNLISLFVYILRFGAIVLTLSRSAFLGTVVLLFLLNMQRWRRHWKISLGIFGLLLVGIIGLSFLKSESTLAHIQAKLSSISYVLQKPLGYGLGSSGPAIHHNGKILPENYFIQLLIDIGVIGFAFWSVLTYFCLRKIRFLSQQFQGIFGDVSSSIFLGRIGLLFLGMFLHSFEDSMVNYIFFCFAGFVIGFLNYGIKERIK